MMRNGRVQGVSVGVLGSKRVCVYAQPLAFKCIRCLNVTREPEHVDCGQTLAVMLTCVHAMRACERWRMNARMCK